MLTPDDGYVVLPVDFSTGLAIEIFCLPFSRSGYEDAENRQNGAAAPIFSRLKAIYKEPKSIRISTSGKKYSMLEAWYI